MILSHCLCLSVFLHIHCPFVMTSNFSVLLLTTSYLGKLTLMFCVKNCLVVCTVFVFFVRTCPWMYHAYFSSIMTYGIMFWGNSSAAIKVFRLQKQAVRLLSDCHSVSKRVSRRTKFRQLNILTLPCVHVLEQEQQTLDQNQQSGSLSSHETERLVVQ